MASFQPISFSIYASILLILFGQVWCKQNCGKAFGPDLEEYVLGGEDAIQGEWPWMVALTELNETTGKQSPICTGFLIDNRHVISAAHCFRRNQSSFYSTRIGHVNLTLGDVYPISDIAVHGDFVKGQFYHDIALITLSKDVNVPNFNPICLPPVRALRNLTGRGTTFVGWGATRRAGEMSPILKQLSAIPVWSNHMCNEVWDRFLLSLPHGITSSMICAGIQEEPGRDICWGDSGGPLMIREQNRWYAVGMAAFGYSCGRPDYPGVYTRVSKYLNWIKETKDLVTRRTIQASQQPQLYSPWLDERCANSSGGQNACKDIRECDFAVSILANGGWPKVCDWVNDEISENNSSTKWPKVCCGIPQIVRETLITAFVMEEARKGDCGKILPEAKEQGLWPWMVKLHNTKYPTDSISCAAVMIDRRHFIVQTRCFPALWGNAITATIGSMDSNQTYNVIGMDDVMERSSIGYNGIILCTLSRDVEDPDFTPICLPDSLVNRNLTGMAVTKYDVFLKQTTIEHIISNYACKQLLEGVNNINNTEKYVCTKIAQCHGDRDLLMLEDRGRWNLIGISMRSSMTCEPFGIPNPYTRITEYLDWIKEKTN